MRNIVTTNQFERDVTRMTRRGKDIAKLERVVETLREQGNVEAQHRTHPLRGEWKPKWECHIEADWLLIYEVTESAVRLARTGTHSDLFE